MALLSKVTYTGDGSTKRFSISFDYLDVSHLQISVDSVIKTLTTDYTVDTATQEVVFTTAPANTLEVVIERITPIATVSRYVDFSAVPPASEADLDNGLLYNLFLTQELKDDVSGINLTPEIITVVYSYAEMRTLTPPASNQTIILSDGADSGYFSYDAASTTADDGQDVIKPDSVGGGDPGRWLRILGLASSTFVVDKTALEALSISGMPEGTAIYMGGRTTVGDGGEGWFRLVLSDPSLSADGGIVIDAQGSNNWWVRVRHNDLVNVKWFGATGAGYSTDDSTAIQSILTAGYRNIYFPNGTYYVSTAISYSTEVSFIGSPTHSINNPGSVILGETSCFQATETGSNRDVIFENLSFSSRNAASVGVQGDINTTSGFNTGSYFKNCHFYRELETGIRGTFQGGTIENCTFGMLGSTNRMLRGVDTEVTSASTALHMVKCKFRNATDGARLSTLSGGSVLACEFESLKNNGLVLKGVQSLKVHASYWENISTAGSGLGSFITFNPSSGGTACRSVVVDGCYFLNNGGVFVNQFFSGANIPAVSFTNNFYAPGGAGKSCYSTSTIVPYLATGNLKISEVNQFTDEENFLDEDSIGQEYSSLVVGKYTQSADGGIILEGATRLNMLEFDEMSGLFATGSQVHMLINTKSITGTHRLLDWNQGWFGLVLDGSDYKFRFVQNFSGTNYDKRTAAIDTSIIGDWKWITLSYDGSSTANEFSVIMDAITYDPASGTTPTGTISSPSTGEPASIGGTDTGGDYYDGMISRAIIMDGIDQTRRKDILRTGVIDRSEDSNTILNLDLTTGKGTSFVDSKSNKHWNAVGPVLHIKKKPGSFIIASRLSASGHMSEGITLSATPNVLHSSDVYYDAIYIKRSLTGNIRMGDSSGSPATLFGSTSATAGVWTKFTPLKASASTFDPYVELVSGGGTVDVFIVCEPIPTF